MAAQNAAAELADVANDKRSAELRPGDKVRRLWVVDHLVELGDKVVGGHGFAQDAHGGDEAGDGHLCVVAATAAAVDRGAICVVVHPEAHVHVVVACAGGIGAYRGGMPRGEGVAIGRDAEGGRGDAWDWRR